MIELRQLKHIAALAKFRSFRLAAEAVHISQPALSLSVKAAEQALGQKLFIRSNKTITPTTYGEIVVELAERIVNDVNNMTREINLLSGIDTGFLRICLSPYIHFSISGKLIERFMKLYPGFSLDLVSVQWEHRIGLLRNKKVDLMVEVYASNPPKRIFHEHDIEVVEVPIPPIRYYCRADHPLAKKDKVTYEDIRQYPWGGEGGPPAYHSWLAQAAGLTSTRELPDRRLKFYSSDYNSILTAVLNSDIVSGGSPVFFDKFEKQGLIHYLDVEWKIPHIDHKGYIIYLKSRKLSKVILDTIELVNKILSEIMIEECYT
jgi:DNA-binding transcriptional LysR family regulator